MSNDVVSCRFSKTRFNSGARASSYNQIKMMTTPNRQKKCQLERALVATDHTRI